MKDDALNSASIPNASDSARLATRYSRVAIVLHWLIAALVLSTIPISWFATWGQVAPARPPMGVPSVAAAQAIGNAPDTSRSAALLPGASTQPGAATRPAPPSQKSPAQQSATNLHKTIGVVILFLTALRIGWRLTHKPPTLPESMARHMRWIANAAHALFYLLLVAMPLSGWWTSSAVPSPRRHAFGFGFVDIPFLPVAQSWPAAGMARFIHTNLAWVMIALIVLHVGAALKHQFFEKDDILRRMLPRKFY